MSNDVARKRRRLLKTIAATTVLPWLELHAGEDRDSRKDPPRMIFFYIPGGIARHQWYPIGQGVDYELSDTLQPLDKFRDQFTVLRGLKHLTGQIVGHGHPLNYLTGHAVVNNVNSVSVDQVFASHFGDTYCPSLNLSYASGVGDHTLSRNSQGIDIPSLSSAASVYEFLFPPSSIEEKQKLINSFDRRRRIVDAVQSETRALLSELGYSDRQRLANYTDALSEMERRIIKRQEILKKESLDLSVSEIALEKKTKSISWRERIETMTDLIVLAFQTDLTRVSTYLLGGEGHPFYPEYDLWAESVRSDRIGVHDLHHKGSTAANINDNAGKILALRDKFFVTCLARLMEKLQDLPAKDGSVLDYTQILFGGAQSTSHHGHDAPILVAGGKKLGWKHGRQHIYWQPHAEIRAHGAKHAIKRIGGADVPDGTFPSKPTVSLSDLYYTMLHQSGCPIQRFKESNRLLTEVVN